MTAPKQEEIKVRVTSEMKARVLALAAERGEGESVIVREALKEYLEHRPSSRKTLHALRKAERAVTREEARAKTPPAPRPAQSAP